MTGTRTRCLSAALTLALLASPAFAQDPDPNAIVALNNVAHALSEVSSPVTLARVGRVHGRCADTLEDAAKYHLNVLQRAAEGRGDEAQRAFAATRWYRFAHRRKLEHRGAIAFLLSSQDPINWATASAVLARQRPSAIARHLRSDERPEIRLIGARLAKFTYLFGPDKDREHAIKAAVRSLSVEDVGVAVRFARDAYDFRELRVVDALAALLRETRVVERDGRHGRVCDLVGPLLHGQLMSDPALDDVRDEFPEHYDQHLLLRWLKENRDRLDFDRPGDGRVIVLNEVVRLEEDEPRRLELPGDLGSLTFNVSNVRRGAFATRGALIAFDLSCKGEGEVSVDGSNSDGPMFGLYEVHGMGISAGSRKVDMRMFLKATTEEGRYDMHFLVGLTRGLHPRGGHPR